MTPLEIMFVLAVVGVLIVQYLHFNYKLKKERLEKESYSEDSKKARENYTRNLNSLKLENNILEEVRSKLKDEVKSWKDSSELKQIALDNANLKIDTLYDLLQDLKLNWNKRLSIVQGEEVSWPALRLTISDEAKGYLVKSYQGSKDLQSNTSFFFQIDEKTCLDLESVLIDIKHQNNPVESKSFQSIVKFLKQTHE